jgi:hypothetical protein
VLIFRDIDFAFAGSVGIGLVLYRNMLLVPPLFAGTLTCSLSLFAKPSLALVAMLICCLFVLNGLMGRLVLDLMEIIR